MIVISNIATSSFENHFYLTKRLDEIDVDIFEINISCLITLDKVGWVLEEILNRPAKHQFKV